MEAYQVLNALGDPTRRRIIELLGDRPHAVGELAERLPVSRPAVSQHLRVLAESGLVARESVGTRNVYRLDDRGVDALRSWLDGFWTTALTRFAGQAEQEARRPS